MPGTTTLALTIEQRELVALAASALRNSLRDHKNQANLAIEQTRLEVSSQIFIRLAAETKASPMDTERLATMAINAANVFISAYMHINGKAD